MHWGVSLCGVKTVLISKMSIFMHIVYLDFILSLALRISKALIYHSQICLFKMFKCSCLHRDVKVVAGEQVFRCSRLLLASASGYFRLVEALLDWESYINHQSNIITYVLKIKRPIVSLRFFCSLAKSKHIKNFCCYEIESAFIIISF